jgi:hypothetical protein
MQLQLNMPKVLVDELRDSTECLEPGLGLRQPVILALS